MRLARKRAGLTLQEMGDLLGVTRQQVAKYEDGISRIAAEQLMLVAHRCDVPLTFFYDASSTQAIGGAVEREQAQRIEKAFAQVENLDKREYLIAIVENAASSDLSMPPAYSNMPHV